ncbi:MAG TPA: putative metal-dependent hydrolase [Gemmatimonadaceae bacterium]|nr:putative metal-dependent hydrolase [Gemmatimonadaceae bacterium]
MSNPRFPIGEFNRPERLTGAERQAAIETIESAPATLRRAVSGMPDAQLDSTYREGSWTLRQVVHHLADSHVNSYARFRLALTEDHPRIKAYDEARWAELDDARTMPVEVSLKLLESLHARWVHLLRSMKPADFAKTIDHPENGTMSLDQLVAMYSWHCDHHIAHINLARNKK